MARTISGNYDALVWVQDEVQQSLADALQALTTFIDEPDNDAAIELCITQIHQVSGTMEMLNLHGAHLLASEMLNSAIAIRDTRNSDTNSAIQDSILKGLLLLPNYLKLLGSELEDHPLHLLATLNELRIARGNDAFDTNDLFSPNLLVALPDKVMPNPSQPLPKLSISTTKLGHAFQYSLLRWFKDDEPELSLRRMSNIARYLRLSCIQERSVVLWWAAEGVFEGLLQKGLPATAEVKLMIGRLTTPIKLFTHEGEQDFIALYPSDLSEELLLQVARTISSGRHVTTLKDTFNLNFFDPQQHQKIYNFTDNALLDVHSELINQIQEIKEEIERFNEQNPSADIIDALVSQLNNMAGTFDLLNDEDTSAQLRQQANTLGETVAQQQLPSDDEMLALADTLLKIEYQLQSGQKIDNKQAVENDQLQQTVIAECLNELISIKETIVTLDESSDNPPDALTEIASQLELIAGSLTILNLDDAARLLENTAQQLLQTVNDGKSLSRDELDLFAEIIASVDLYMEGIKQGGSQQSQLLRNAHNILSQFNADIDEPIDTTSLETTSNEPVELELEPAPIPETSGKLTSVDHYIQNIAGTGVDRYLQNMEQATTPTVATEETGVARYIREQQSNTTVAQSLSNFAEGIDSEIAAIFVEEAQEVLSQQAELIPQWQSDQDSEKLTEIRRSFHTLKGSGHMAGANVIGEVSWSIEHLLNQVLDSTQPLTPEIIELVAHAHNTVPDLISRFSSGEMAATDASNHIVDSANDLLTEESDDDELALTEVETPVSAEAIQLEDSSSEDDELRQIFYSEATQHIDTFKQAIEHAEIPFALNKDLLRAAHSLKGCANIAQVTSVATIAVKLDQTLRSLYENQTSLDEQQFSLLSNTIAGLESIIEDFWTGEKD